MATSVQVCGQFSPVTNRLYRALFTFALQRLRVNACPSVCASVCLSLCVSVCMPACLSVCLCLCVSVCMSACVYICLCVSVCLFTCLFVCLFVCLCVYLSACIVTSKHYIISTRSCVHGSSYLQHLF